MLSIKKLLSVSLLGTFFAATGSFAFPLDGFYCTAASDGNGSTVMHFVPSNQEKDQGTVTTYVHRDGKTACIGKQRDYKFQNYNYFSDTNGMQGWVSYFGLLQISEPPIYVGDYSKGQCDVSGEVDPC